MTNLPQLLQAHSEQIDSMVSEFANSMESMLAKASESIAQTIRSEVNAAGGLVEATRANQKFFAGLDKRFVAAMEEVGYSELVDSYVESFNGQFVWFDQILDFINSNLDNPLPAINFDRTDLAELKAYQVGAKDLIQSAVDQAALRARQKAMLSAGGMPVKELARQLQDSWHTSVSESANLAETSVATFYRTITDKGYQVIEADLPDVQIRYNYEGPLDKLNRPFCIKLEKQSRNGKTWTREMISKMNNGQLPNVFLTCGGYRCRHQWVISIPRDAKRNPSTTGTSRERLSRAARAERVLAADRVARAGGKPHPHEQIKAIREKVQADIQQTRRKANA